MCTVSIYECFDNGNREVNFVVPCIFLKFANLHIFSFEYNIGIPSRKDYYSLLS